MNDRPIVYLDANIFIQELESETDDVGFSCKRLIDAARDRLIRGVTSELTLAEVLVRPSRERRFDRKRAYLALFSARRALFDLRAVTRKVLVESVEYQAHVLPTKPDPTESKRNFLPDAIHVVTAIEAEASHFATSDRRIRLPAGMQQLDPRGPHLGAFLDRVT